MTGGLPDGDGDVTLQQIAQEAVAQGLDPWEALERAVLESARNARATTEPPC